MAIYTCNTLLAQTPRPCLHLLRAVPKTNQNQALKSYSIPGSFGNLLNVVFLKFTLKQHFQVPTNHQFKGVNLSHAPWVCNYHHHYWQFGHEVERRYHFSETNVRKSGWDKQRNKPSRASLEWPALFRAANRVDNCEDGEEELRMCVGGSPVFFWILQLLV